MKKFGKDPYPGLFDDQWPSGGGSAGHAFKRCYHSHPALPLGEHGGQPLVIYGGNCHSPVVLDADIYVGLDHHASLPGGVKWPWEKGFRQPLLVDFPITDSHAPKSVKEFKALIDWLCNQLQSGKKIHVGCIGGHGRTGTVLAAVVAQLLGEHDAVGYVRQYYCDRAAETSVQIDFLVQHYGIKPVSGSKNGPVLSAGSGMAAWGGAAKVNGYQGSSGGSSKSKTVAFANARRTIAAVSSPKNVW